MEDFKDIDIIVATRIDNYERSMNAFLTYKFFKDHTINSKFIFVEDSIRPDLRDCLPLEQGDKIIYEKNNVKNVNGIDGEGEFRKCRSYNKGIKQSERKYLLFLDLDCVVNPAQIIKTKQNIEKEKVIAGAVFNEKDCPSHGGLKIRGRSFEGIVTKKHDKRITIEFERMIYIRKYERYAKKKGKIHARLPDCMINEINIGDFVRVRECRPLSKIIHFAVIEKINNKK